MVSAVSVKHTFFAKYLLTIRKFCGIINQYRTEYSKEVYRLITFVCGVPCSGKTAFIEKNLPNQKVLDIFKYQEKKCFLTLQAMLECQSDAMHDLLEASKHGDVVMEHTLLRKERRSEQIDFLRSNGYDGEIHLVFLNPPFNELIKRGKERKVGRDFIKNHLDILELPTEDECFTSITIIGE